MNRESTPNRRIGIDEQPMRDKNKKNASQTFFENIQIYLQENDLPKAFETFIQWVQHSLSTKNKDLTDIYLLHSCTTLSEKMLKYPELFKKTFSSQKIQMYVENMDLIFDFWIKEPTDSEKKASFLLQKILLHSVYLDQLNDKKEIKEWLQRYFYHITITIDQHIKIGSSPARVIQMFIEALKMEEFAKKYELLSYHADILKKMTRYLSTLTHSESLTQNEAHEVLQILNDLFSSEQLSLQLSIETLETLLNTLKSIKRQFKRFNLEDQVKFLEETIQKRLIDHSRHKNKETHLTVQILKLLKRKPGNRASFHELLLTLNISDAKSFEAIKTVLKKMQEEQLLRIDEKNNEIELLNIHNDELDLLSIGKTNPVISFSDLLLKTKWSSQRLSTALDSLEAKALIKKEMTVDGLVIYFLV